MKKSIILFFLMLIASLAFAQMEDTDIPITGVGDFVLGMSSDEMYDIIENSRSKNTKISGVFDGESSLVITNLQAIGYNFDECFFTFKEDKLIKITLKMYLDKKNKEPKEFDDLLLIIENDYGKQEHRKANTKDEKRLTYIWSNKDKSMLFFYKSLEKKRTEITISVKKSTLDISNLDVYAQ